MAPELYERGRRLELQTILEDILGSRNVYFQPPSDILIAYPAIVYSHTRTAEKYANNNLYQTKRAYTITVIDRDPESLIPDRIHKLPMCSFDRRFVADSLHHMVYTIYF